MDIVHWTSGWIQWLHSIHWTPLDNFTDGHHVHWTSIGHVHWKWWIQWIHMSRFTTLVTLLPIISSKVEFSWGCTLSDSFKYFTLILKMKLTHFKSFRENVRCFEKIYQILNCLKYLCLLGVVWPCYFSISALYILLIITGHAHMFT